MRIIEIVRGMIKLDNNGKCTFDYLGEKASIDQRQKIKHDKEICLHIFNEGDFMKDIDRTEVIIIDHLHSVIVTSYIIKKLGGLKEDV